MPNKTLKHFILMRFFPFQASKYPHNILDVDFLSKQLPLTRNALVSLENQTNKNFELIFILHPNFFDDKKYEFIFTTLKESTKLPIKFIRSTAQNRSIRNFSSLDYTFGTYSNPELFSWISDAYINCDFVITTKMDFDDFVFKNAVEDTQNKINECNDILFYGYNNGYQYVQGELYPLYYGEFWEKIGHHSVFQSLIVKSSFAKELPCITVGEFPHNRIVTSLKPFLADNGLRTGVHKN